MKYLYPETVQFWRIGQKLFHGRFLRFMSGPKSQGQIVQGQLTEVSMILKNHV